MKPLEIDQAALSELQEAMDWYDEKQMGLGEELKRNVFDAIARLRAHPERFPKLPRSPYRFCRASRFPYVIYFRVRENRIRLTAISHERQRPGYWKHRG